jgi:RNA polymerase sigma-70 factor (ECF subfamily)
MQKEQNRDNFEVFLEEHQDKVYRICQGYAYYHDVTKDLYQEVLLNLWSSWVNFKGQSKVTTWMYRVTVNTAITFNKKEKKYRQELGGALNMQLADDQQEKLDKIQTERALSSMHMAISKLPKAESMMIGLYLEDVSYKDIAEILGSSTNFVGVKINRIKKKLATQLG